MSDAVEIFETSDHEDESKNVENVSIDSDADTVDDESIERSRLDAQKAFERFQYFPSSKKKEEKGDEDVGRRLDFSQRFSMLSEEVKRLSEDLEAQCQEESKASFSKFENASKTLSETVLLKKRLEGLELDSRLRGLIDPEYRVREMLSDQSEISSQIMADAANFSKAEDKSSSSSNNSTLTYELYHNVETVKVREAEAMNDLELRIASIEKLLHQKDEDGNRKGTSTILSAIHKMESQMELLRPQTLDALSRRMKTIATEYESFSRRMSRARSKTGGVSNPIRAKKLSTALEKIDSYDKISASIPSLVNRLKTLRALHEESATFSNRLSVIEKRQERALGDLDRSEKLITELEVSMRENMKTIASNIKILDGRIDKCTSF